MTPASAVSETALSSAALEDWRQLLQTNRSAEAFEAMEDWLALYPDEETALTLALIHWLIEAGATERAHECLTRLLASPDLPQSTRLDVLCVQAGLLSHEGKSEDARQTWLKALSLDEHHGRAWAGLATLLDARNYPEEALEAWKRAAASDEADLTAFLRWAQAAQSLAQPLEVVSALTRACQHWPDDALLCLLKGAAHDGANQPKEAQAAYAQAQALSGSGSAFHRMAAQYFGGRGEAVRAITHWVEVLALEPADTDATAELARLLLSQQRPEDAIALLKHTVTTCPDVAALWIQLGHAQGDLGQVSDALESFDRAMALSDDREQGALQLRKALTLPVIADSEDMARQSFARAQMALRTLAKFSPPLVDGLGQIGATPYFLSLQDEPLAPTMRWFQQAVAGLPVLNLQADAPLRSTGSDPRPVIGVVSRYWQTGHWVSQLAGGLFEQLNREQFRVVWIRLGTSTQPMGVTVAAADQVVSIPITDEATMAQQVAALALDGLIYPDAGIEPAAFYLSRHRLARRQALLWSAPMTSGAASVDSVLTAEEWLPVTDALAEGMETPLTCLDSLPAYFKRPVPPERGRWREDFGFVAGQQIAVLGAPLYKIHPQMDGLIEALLTEHPTLSLVVREASTRDWSQQLQRRWERSLSADVRTRVRWLGPVSPSDWQELLRLSDVVLDSLPTHDPTTTLAALGWGTPVVTLMGRFQRQRWTTGFLKELGLGAWSAGSPTQWLAAIKDILRDPAAARCQVEAAQPRLFERQDWVRSFETLLNQWLAA